MTITLITAGFMLLINLILAFNVIRQRVKTQTMLGDGDAPVMLRAIRAQANLVEYAPLFLIGLGALEYMGGSFYLLLGLGATFTLARLIHGYGLGFTDGSVRFYRMVGTLLTFLCTLVLGVACLLVGYGG